MKEGWKVKPLGEVCTLEKLQGIHSSLPYVGLEDIESHTAKFIGSLEPKTVKSSTFRFTSDHVLYGRLRPYLNKVIAPNFEGHCSTEIFPIKPSHDVLREYLLYWILCDQTCERINATCTGARMPRAQMSEVLELEFLLPPLPDQHRIVAILDEAFDGIATAKANAEKNLQNARALFESHLQSVFTQREGWFSTTIEKCFRLKSGDNLTSKEMKPGNYPVYGGNGIAGMHNSFNISDESLIIGRVGALCGNARKINQKIWLTDNAFRVVDFKYEFDLTFLTYLLNFKNLRNLARQAAQPVISNSSLKDLVLDFPSISEQRTIAIQLDTFFTETQRL